MSNSSTFGVFLRQLRKRAGMTQGDLAAAVGYSVSFVCDLEQNRRQPAVDVVLQQFVPALGLQDEVTLSAHLVELAALARGERPPSTITLQRSVQVSVSETFALPSSRLPMPPTELIGREQVIKTLCNRLQSHSGRLLTLVGPPGVGKTTLALAVARQLESLFKDGARFVALAAVSDAELVASAIATELELVDTGKQSPQVRLIQALRQKEMLLLLDNFEQIIAAAPLLATLLAQCPGVHVLVTSRERLHLRAEQRFPVPPLDLSFAVALFVQRVQMVDPGFEYTSENQPILEKICQRLDCLPLAIELIAARSDLFSPQSMLNRLQVQALDLLAENAQDAPAHQQTLRRAIQYSYDLLADHERALFRTLGVFVDGFDLEAVAHLGFSHEALQVLINKSLVHLPARQAATSTMAGERRFLLLEMLREYALDQLNVHQEVTQTKQQHAAYYLQLLERSEPEIHSAQLGAWLNALEREHNNLRAAITWAIAKEDGTTALRLCGVLQWFWGFRGYCHEGKTWLEKSLLIQADVPQTVRAKALSAVGYMEHMLGNHAQAQRRVEASLAIYQTLNDQRNAAEMSLQLAGIIRQQHHYATAKFFYEQSFHLFQTLEAYGRIPRVHFGLGNLAMNQGDYRQARIHYEQALGGHRAYGDKYGMIEILPRLAQQAFQQGDYSRARVCCEELLVLSQELGNQLSIAQALNQLGSIAIEQGELSQALHHLAQSFTLAQMLSYPPLTMSVLTNQGKLAVAQAEWVQARQLFCQSLQIAHQLVDIIEIASSLECLAGIAQVQADLERATRLLAAAESLRQRIGSPLPASDQMRHHRMIAAIHSQLDETVYAHLYAEGHAMTPDQAVVFALVHFAESKWGA